MLVDTEKRKSFIINFGYYFIIIGMVFIVLKYGLPFIAPFVSAFVIAFLLNKPITFLAKKCHVNRTLIAIAIVLVFYSIIGILFALLGIRLFVFVKELFSYLPNLYATEIQPFLMQLFDSLEHYISKMDVSLLPAMNEFSSNVVQSLGELISSFSMKMIGAISNYASSLPGFFIRILFTIISTFFLVIDYKKITAFLLHQLKDKHQKLMIEIKDYVVNTLFKCILSYALIMCITFAELSVGLSIIRIENAVLIAFVISIFDILPVLGTGGIMIPWTIIAALQGNYSLALGLLIVYIIITLIRNILEPKIVGSQVGLHPLVTLMSLFVGAQLFGVLGLFGLPITLSLLKNLNDKGTIHILK